MERSNWIPALLAGAVAGLAGGWAGAILLAPPAGPAGQSDSYDVASSVAPRASEEADLPEPALPLSAEADPARLATLTGRMDELERQIALLRAEVAGRRRIDRSETAPDLDPQTLEPILDQTVSAILDEREAQAEAERRAREEERRQARLDRQMERWQQELGLTDVQAADMRTILDQAEQKRIEFFRAMREEGTFDREAMRNFMERSNEELTVALGGILTSDQLAKFQESTSGRFGAMGAMFDRGGRGGGPPGGGRRGG
ncbi:MAG: hypothetical protein D6702_11290 [Planctomycetota bacterium]|nr:MAG: hypothetical protein D6702_11290 [Planctomycetota bacterium]